MKQCLRVAAAGRSPDRRMSRGLTELVRAGGGWGSLCFLGSLTVPPTTTTTWTQWVKAVSGRIGDLIEQRTMRTEAEFGDNVVGLEREGQ